jgi:hypothetical protein
MNEYNYNIGQDINRVNFIANPSLPKQEFTPIAWTGDMIPNNQIQDEFTQRSQDGGINPYYYDAKLRSESKEASGLLLLANRWTSLKSSALQEYGGYSAEEVKAIEEDAKNKGEEVNLTKYLSPEKLSLLTNKLNQEYGLKLSAQDINAFDTNPNYLESLKTKAEETIYNNSNVLSEITELRMDSLGEWLKTAFGSSDTNLSSSIG